MAPTHACTAPVAPRPAVEADLPELRRLLTENEALLESGGGDPFYLSISDSFAKSVNTGAGDFAAWVNFCERYGRGGACLWVVEHAGAEGEAPPRLAGCVAVLPRDPERGVFELVRMLVDNTARRQGIGRRLFAALCDHARAQGGREIYLSTPCVNTPAQRFYTALGFQIAREFTITHVVASGEALELRLVEMRVPVGAVAAAG